MICANLHGGPCDGTDYHFMAASQPPDVIIMGRVREDHPWTRLIGSMMRDPDFQPQTYRLTDPTPGAIDDDGEPCFDYHHVA